MRWRVVHVEAESTDRAVQVFAWVLVASAGFWVVAVAALIWGLCS